MKNLRVPWKGLYYYSKFFLSQLFFKKAMIKLIIFIIFIIPCVESIRIFKEVKVEKYMVDTLVAEIILDTILDYTDEKVKRLGDMVTSMLLP